MSSVRGVSAQTFAVQVLDASQHQPVLVDFWAPWCGPCRALAPVLDQLATELAGKLSVVKLNTDEEPEIASRFAIRSIPAVKLFRHGRVVAEFVGAQPLAAVRAFVQPHLPRASEAAHAAARKLGEAGQIDAARTALLAVVSEDPDNHAASIDLARYEALAGNAERARQILVRLPPALHSEPATQSALALVHFASLVPPAPGADPAATRTRAASAILGGSVESAVEVLFADMKASRAFAVGAGKNDLLQVFALLGANDERVVAWRRRLAALLN